MKLKFNPLVQQASGKMGDLVFYELNGQPVARRKGQFKDAKSKAQLAHRERVRQAAAWSRTTMSDPKQKAEYKAACQGHQTPYNIGVRDFMTPPVVESVGCDNYTGRVGQRLQIKAWDDFEVVEVVVSIKNQEGDLIEEGLAARTNEAGIWEYTTRKAAPAGESVRVEVTAKDRPGNQAQQSAWHFLGAAQ